MIDNYDSFTYNLVQALGALGHELIVFRSDRTTIPELSALQPRRIVISPGPGRPEQAGISCQVIRAFAPHTWTLGVCLGHQCIGHVFGMPVVRAPEIMHGKTSWVVHDNQDVHQGLPNPFAAMRYHSLALRAEDLPDCLTPTARTLEGTLMGVRHQSWKLIGVQYHPESFLTAPGPALLKNFMELPG
jgi:anthranilate synthase/aminodeoxychorismate synthase-like glutamine amidotransferase